MIFIDLPSTAALFSCSREVYVRVRESMWDTYASASRARAHTCTFPSYASRGYVAQRQTCTRIRICTKRARRRTLLFVKSINWSRLSLSTTGLYAKNPASADCATYDTTYPRYTFLYPTDVFGFYLFFSFSFLTKLQDCTRSSLSFSL